MQNLYKRTQDFVSLPQKILNFIYKGTVCQYVITCYFTVCEITIKCGFTRVYGT